MAYPESLPVPQTSSITKAERRALSSEDRPREATPMQLDGKEFETLTWKPMRAEQMAVFLAWWRNELIFGGAWFSATWPLPRGMVSAVRKFVQQPQREFVPGGFWRVTATCEIRGSGVFPYVPAEPVSYTFDFTDAEVQTLEIPAGFRTATVYMVGAGGGLGTNENHGGGGGFTSGSFRVFTGETLSIYVGQIGTAGGNNRQGAGGGGGSAILRGSTVLAAAGGGAGAGCSGFANVYPGGAGGGSNGQTAPQERNLSGGGATQSGPGVAPSGQPSQRFTGLSGSGPDGGNGTNIGGTTAPIAPGGWGYGTGGFGASHNLDGGSGGGGGGYYGGSSGSGDDGGAGGGGGSGFAPDIDGVTITGVGRLPGENDVAELIGYGGGGHPPGISATPGRILITLT